jgi:hypothetical protein
VFPAGCSNGPGEVSRAVATGRAQSNAVQYSMSVGTVQYSMSVGTMVVITAFKECALEQKCAFAKEIGMPKEAHNKAAEHHENAAKSHRTAAEHHGKGDHSKATEESTKARGHSKTAHEHSEIAHNKSQSQK